MGVPDQVKNRFAHNFFKNVNLFKDLENHRANVKAMSKKDREKLIPYVEVITVENSDEYKKNFKKNIKQIQDVNKRPDCLRLKIMQGDPAQLLPVLDSAL